LAMVAVLRVADNVPPMNLFEAFCLMMFDIVPCSTHSRMLPWSHLCVCAHPCKIRWL
jgi:hypothetical protein